MNNFSTKAIKKKSLADLKGKYGICIVEILLVALISAICEAPSLILNFSTVPGSTFTLTTAFSMILSLSSIVLVIALLLPVSIGNNKFYLNIAEGKEAKISDIFFYKNMNQVICTNLIYGLMILAIVAIYVGCVITGTTVMLANEAAGLAILFVTIVVYLIVVIYVAFAYVMTTFIIADCSTEGVIAPLKASRKMMKGNKWNFFVLELSFIGWIILGAFTFGILYFWLVPYLQTACANFYLNVKNSNN